MMAQPLESKTTRPDLTDKVQRAINLNKLYTPTQEEWNLATDWQKKYMTWPREVLAQIERERA